MDSDLVARVGAERYKQILSENPMLEKESCGKEIYIYTKTGEYVVGMGIAAFEQLRRKVKAEDGQNFYCRRIGSLLRIPAYSK